MNRQEYLNKRKALITDAENLLKEGKFTEYEAKEKEVKDLDAKWEQFTQAQANINALKDKGVVVDAAFAAATGITAGVVVDRLLPGEVKDEKKEYLAAWGKSMLGQHLSDSERAVFDKVNTDFRNATQTAATHQIVIPETVAAGIWKEAGQLFPLLGDTPMTFVKGDLTLLQETDSGGDAEWYDEDDTVADGDFAIGELNLTGCELAKAVPISWKLKKMSIDEFIPYITSLLAEKMGAALAKGIVSGKGKPGVGDEFKAQAKGIVTVLEAEADTPQIVTYSDGENDGMSYNKMTQAMSKVKSQYVSGGAIYAKNDTIWNTLAQIKDLQGRPMFIPDVTAGGVGRMFGLIVKVDDSVAANAVIIGNVRKGYAANVNENMTIYTEENIKKRYTDYMGYAIVDGGVRTTKAFAYIKKVVAG